MKKQQEVMEIDLLQLAKALWHRAWAIVLAMVVFGAGAAAYANFLITPLYKASAKLYVNNSSFSVGSTSISMSDLSTSSTLVNTYTVILNTRFTMNEVIRQADLDYSYEQLCGMVSASAVDSTGVMQVTVTSTDPQEAEKIANTICEILPDRIAEIVEGSSGRIVDYAVAPSAKASPSVSSYAAKGLLLGLVLSCGLIILLELLDEKIRDEDYLLETYDLPVLTVVPDLVHKSKASKGYYGYGAAEGERST